ncbi:MAG: DUF3108 domain-containing protein [Paludibacter sp.]
MSKKIFILISFVLVNLVLHAQVKSGERLVFAGSYEVSGLMTNIAQLTMSTSSMQTAKNNYLHLRLEMATFNKWDSFFKIRDIYESYVNPTSLKPALYKRSIYEGGYSKTEKYAFQPDGTTVKSVTKRGNRAETQNTFKIGTSTIDVVTLIYKLRSTNFAAMKPGSAVAYILVFDEKQHAISVKYIGKETVQAGNLGKKECYKLAIVANTNKLKGKDKNLIYLTADAKKVPALIKFSIPVGVGQLTLTSASGI